MKKLAFAAQQKLRGVIIEFDVIRSLRDPNMEFMQKMKYHVEKTNTSIQVKPKVKSKWWSNWFTRHQSTVSIRDKYKDKLLVLKKKSKQSICVEEEARRLDQLARLKWRVNEGANTFVVTSIILVFTYLRVGLYGAKGYFDHGVFAAG